MLYEELDSVLQANVHFAQVSRNYQWIEITRALSKQEESYPLENKKKSFFVMQKFINLQSH